VYWNLLTTTPLQMWTFSERFRRSEAILQCYKTSIKQSIRGKLKIPPLAKAELFWLHERKRSTPVVINKLQPNPSRLLSLIIPPLSSSKKRELLFFGSQRSQFKLPVCIKQLGFHSKTSPNGYWISLTSSSSFKIGPWAQASKFLIKNSLNQKVYPNNIDKRQDSYSPTFWEPTKSTVSLRIDQR